MIVYSHPTGNANVRQSAQALAEAGLLAEFWTCIHWKAKPSLARLIPGGLRRQLARRSFPSVLNTRIRTSPWREWGRLLAPHLALECLTQHETGLCSVDAVYRALDRKVAARLPHLAGVTGVYAADDGACQTFHRAQMLGVMRFYELPTAYWRATRQILAEEKEREPQWAATMTGLRDSPEKLARKDEEIGLADVIFVASTFAKKTLERVPHCRAAVRVLPYGAPPAPREPEIAQTHSPKLRVLFVGNLTQQKGIADLFNAVALLRDHVELTLIGKKPNVSCPPLDAALQRHRWQGALPPCDVLKEMRHQDVLVLPSLSDGFGLVILEAMSQGLPVITTPHTGGPDVITDGEEGFIVPVRSAEVIAERLAFLLHQPNVLQDMKFAAWKTAKSRSWARYRERIQSAVVSELGECHGQTHEHLS